MDTGLSENMACAQFQGIANICPTKNYAIFSIWFSNTHIAIPIFLQDI